MTLLGIETEKINTDSVNLYYYHSAIGQGQSRTFLDRHNIELLVDDSGTYNIIYDSGIKKRLTTTRNCYFSIEIDDVLGKAQFKDLFEEDIMVLDTLNMLSIFRQNDRKSGLLNYAEVLLNINPPLYFFRSFHELPRNSTSNSKYGYNVELIVGASFFEIYRILDPDLKTNHLNSIILNRINEEMEKEKFLVERSLVRGEFETTDQFNQRKEAEIIKMEKLLENNLNFLRQTEHLMAMEMDQKIKESYKLVEIKIEEIGNYDADNQVFPITIKGETKLIKIPIEFAEDFKNHKDEIKVTAESQLSEDSDEFIFFNIRIISPFDGTIILF